jgi:hypothetical protein
MKHGRYFGYRSTLLPSKGSVIAQAVSRWLPTAAARAHVRVWSSGICGGQSGAGAGFLRILWFPLPILILQNSPLSQSPRAGTICQEWPSCQVDPVWTLSPTKRIKKNNSCHLLFDIWHSLIFTSEPLSLGTSLTVHQTDQIKLILT